MAAMMITKLTSERSTISFRPKRSPRRPQAGARTAVSPGVTARLIPVHIAIWPMSVTTSCPMYSGRNGIASVKPVYPMNEAAVTAATLRRQAVATGRWSEMDPYVLCGSDMDAVDEPDAVRIILHDHRTGAG